MTRSVATLACLAAIGLTVASAAVPAGAGFGQLEPTMVIATAAEKPAPGDPCPEPEPEPEPEPGAPGESGKSGMTCC